MRPLGFTFIVLLTGLQVIGWGMQMPGALPPVQVELELVAEPRAPLTAPHDWARSLAGVGVTSVRATRGDLPNGPRIEELQTSTGRIYRVYGLVDYRGDLILPGGRKFTLAQAAHVARWLQELAQLGPEEARPKVDRYGLTADELLNLRQKLALPLGIQTKGRPRRQVLEDLNQKAPVALVDLARHLGQIEPNDLVAEELTELSFGTALAYILRPAGLAAVPTKASTDAATPPAVGLRIVNASEAKEIWPIGWPPAKPPTDLVPPLYQFVEVNVQGVSAKRVVQAVAERTGLPVLWDYNAMARWGADPEKGAVRFPPKSTSYAQLLRHCLFQAGLKYELRVDEADKPFLWITTTKPLDF